MAIEELYGQYLGFAPTDESALGMGELEIIIDKDRVHSRMATGLQIAEEEFSTSELRAVPTEELVQLYKEGSDAPSAIDGYKVGEDEVYFLFTKKEFPDEPGLLIVGSMGDFLGPTVLFNSSQVARGMYDEVLKKIDETEGLEHFPRLQYGGTTRDNSQEEV